MLRRQENNSSVLRQLVCEERGFRAILNELTSFLSRMSIASWFQADSGCVRKVVQRYPSTQRNQMSVP